MPARQQAALHTPRSAREPRGTTRRVTRIRTAEEPSARVSQATAPPANSRRVTRQSPACRATASPALSLPSPGVRLETPIDPLARECESTEARRRRVRLVLRRARCYGPRVSPIIGLGRIGWGGDDGGGAAGLVAMITFYDWLIRTMIHAITSAMSRSAPARNATINRRSCPRFNAALRPIWSARSR